MISPSFSLTMSTCNTFGTFRRLASIVITGGHLSVMGSLLKCDVTLVEKLEKLTTVALLTGVIFPGVFPGKIQSHADSHHFPKTIYIAQEMTGRGQRIQCGISGRFLPLFYRQISTQPACEQELPSTKRRMPLVKSRDPRNDVST